MPFLHGEGISCPELSPRPPAAKHGVNPSPGAGACRDVHTWSTGWGKGEKPLPASPEAGTDPALSRNVACGKHLGTAGRTRHGGLCRVHPTRIPHGSLPHPTCGDHDGSPTLGTPSVTQSTPQELGASRDGQSLCGGSSAVPQGSATRAPASCEEPPPLSDATAPGLANAPGCLHKRGGAGRQAAPVGVADMWDTGMPPSGCQEWGTAGLREPRDVQKVPVLGEELGGFAGTRLIPGANPPHPTEHLPKHPPPRMGKLRHGGGGDGKVQQHQSAGGKNGRKTKPKTKAARRGG